MKKAFIVLTINAVICSFWACSKKDNCLPSPVLTGLEGVWSGKLRIDSFQFNLKPDGILTGRRFATFDTLKGSWSIIDTIFSLTCFFNANPFYRLAISAPVRKDSLKGIWYDNYGSNGSFYLAKNK